MTQKGKSPKSKKAPLIIRIIQLMLYIPIQIVFIPFTFVGIFIGLYKETVIGKKLGVSFSAGQTLQYRYCMHYMDTREDINSVKFVNHYPCESQFGLLSMFGALILSKRLFGFTTGLNRLPEIGYETMDKTAAARVIKFDEILERNLDDVEQVVLPGVGYDLIAQKYTKGKNIRVYELDQVNTINVKTETLKKANIKHDWITYIPVDYNNESWTELLLEAGFDKNKRTLIIWQSVSHFLNEELVGETLKSMSELCSEGSIIAQDFYSKEFISGDTNFAAKKMRNMMAKNGEPWIFGIDMSKDPKAAVETFLKESGLALTSYMQFGEKLEIEPFYCIVESRL